MQLLVFIAALLLAPLALAQTTAPTYDGYITNGGSSLSGGGTITGNLIVTGTTTHQGSTTLGSGSANYITVTGAANGSDPAINVVATSDSNRGIKINTVGTGGLTTQLVTAGAIDAGIIGIVGAECQYQFTESSGTLMLSSTPVNCGGGGNVAAFTYISIGAGILMGGTSTYGTSASGFVANQASYGYKLSDSTFTTSVSYFGGALTTVLYAIETGTATLSTATSQTATLHFSSGTPICTCSVQSQTVFAAVQSCIGTSNTVFTVTLVGSGSEVVAYSCIGLK